MSKCVYCGEKVGFFSVEHKTCREEADRELNNGELLIEEAILNDLPSGEVIERLAAMTATGKLIPYSGAKQAWLRKADQASMTRSHKEPISPEQFENIGNLLEYLEPNFFYLGEKRLNYPGTVSLDHSQTIYQVLHGITPYMPAEASSGFLLSRGENLILKRGASLAEYQQHYSGGNYQSVSLPVGRGIYYRLGAATPRVSRTSLEVIDQGVLALTDQAMYFGGRFQTFRIRYQDVLRLEPYKDAFEICENFGTSKIIVPATLGFDDGWYFFALISAFIDRFRA